MARALAHRSKVLILDEPTSALSTAEAEIAVSSDRGVAAGRDDDYLHLAPHDELLHLGDHFTVLRSGLVVGEAERGEATREWIVETMSGTAIL